jgi:hypothetical protein
VSTRRCPTCGHRSPVPRVPRVVHEAAALILLRTGYSREQIAEHSTIDGTPLDEKQLTVALLEAGAAHLRAVGFTYHGVWETVARLRAKLGAPEPEPVPARARDEQLVLDGGQP